MAMDGVEKVAVPVENPLVSLKDRLVQLLGVLLGGSLGKAGSVEREIEPGRRPGVVR